MSDIHLAPLPPINPREMSSKRLVGYNSWQFRRKAIHRPEVASALVQDVKKVGCDHIMVSGDLVNLALPREFINGASWLRNLGKPENVSFVPGNHDAYVKTSWETGLGLLGDFMTGDLLVKGAQATPSVAMPFPYVRQRRNIALIGLTTAVPSRPGRRDWAGADRRSRNRSPRRSSWPGLLRRSRPGSRHGRPTTGYRRRFRDCWDYRR